MKKHYQPSSAFGSRASASILESKPDARRAKLERPVSTVWKPHCGQQMSVQSLLSGQDWQPVWADRSNVYPHIGQEN
jgi:hypothetical protein